MTTRSTTRPRGGKYAPTRSVRIDDTVWSAAVRRARAEGHTMSHILHLFIEGYGRGMIDPPRVQMVYSDRKSP